MVESMNKYPLIGGSICAVVLIVLASLTNVVGYQTVQSSNQKIITTELNEKDLLFQTIVDMANNKEIQRVILGSELISKRLLDSNMRFWTFTSPEITKKVLKHMYTMGVIFSKTISTSKVQSMLKQYRVHNQRMQKAVSSIIENDAALTEEITRLSNLQCDCDNEYTTTWRFPGICFMLYLLFNFFSILGNYILDFHYPMFIVAILWIIMGLASYSFFNCHWYNPLR
jgi:hypothetical protein